MVLSSIVPTRIQRQVFHSPDSHVGVTFAPSTCISPEESPDFLSATEYCTYLEGYVKIFNLAAHIHLSTKVIKVQPGANGGHIITYVKSGQEKQYACDAVAVCSGLHVTPNIPVIDGINNVPMVMHSSEFKGRKQFGTDKNVMIIGSGETGMDIAHLAVTSPTKSVTLCYRDGFVCVPKVRHFSSLALSGIH